MNLTARTLFRFNIQPSLLLLTCLLGSSTYVAVAQNLDHVNLIGRVVDQHGAVIPGASITALVTRTGLQRTVITDTDGRFRIPQRAWLLRVAHLRHGLCRS